MPDTLIGKNIAILATDGFEQSELEKPKKALEEAGAQTQVVSPKDGKIKGWDMTDWGDEVKVDVPLKSADPSQYDALMLPGGVQNPDKLRMDPDAVRFVKSFFDQGKPVAAICHGPGCCSKPAQRAAAPSPHGPRSKQIFATREEPGLTRKW